MDEKARIPRLEDYAAAAIVGAGRKAIPHLPPDTPLGKLLSQFDAIEDPANRLLKTLAIMVYYHQIGWVPVQDHSPAPASQWPAPSQPVMPATILELFFHFTEPTWTALMKDWARFVGQLEMSVPPEIIPQTLRRVAYFPHLVPYCYAYIMPWADWLLTMKNDEPPEQVWAARYDRARMVSAYERCSLGRGTAVFLSIYMHEPDIAYEALWQRWHNEKLTAQELETTFACLQPHRIESDYQHTAPFLERIYHRNITTAARDHIRRVAMSVPQSPSKERNLERAKVHFRFVPAHDQQGNIISQIEYLPIAVNYETQNNPENIIDGLWDEPHFEYPLQPEERAGYNLLRYTPKDRLAELWGIDYTVFFRAVMQTPSIWIWAACCQNLSDDPDEAAKAARYFLGLMRERPIIHSGLTHLSRYLTAANIVHYLETSRSHADRLLSVLMLMSEMSPPDEYLTRLVLALLDKLNLEEWRIPRLHWELMDRSLVHIAMHSLPNQTTDLLEELSQKIKSRKTPLAKATKEIDTVIDMRINLDELVWLMKEDHNER
ncbi:MAG: hypothetical protein ACLFTK_00030 [Anaerolineales bacterium]